MLFITNRQPVSNDNADYYTFDLEKNAPSNDVYFCERQDHSIYKEVGSKNLLDKLKSSGVKQIFFYIHGFSNLPEADIFPRAEQLQKLFNEKEEDLTLVIPIIWPCDNDKGIIKDYWDDQESADMSGFSFARVLQKFLEWQGNQEESCMKRMNILAHSMGNRVLRETFCNWKKYHLPQGLPLIFRNIFMVAGDVRNETLEKDERGSIISDATKNLVVFYASDDLALRASKITNLKNKIASRRIGHSGPEDMDMVANNVYAIDCDDYNMTYDKFKGHSYFLDDGNDEAGKIFNHIYDCVKTGKVKEEL